MPGRYQGAAVRIIALSCCGAILCDAESGVGHWNCPAADASFFGQVSEAFEEDRLFLEAQQRALNGREDNWACALAADAGAIQARRVLDRMIAREMETLG